MHHNQRMVNAIAGRIRSLLIDRFVVLWTRLELVAADTGASASVSPLSTVQLWLAPVSCREPLTVIPRCDPVLFLSKLTIDLLWPLSSAPTVVPCTRIPLRLLPFIESRNR